MDFKLHSLKSLWSSGMNKQTAIFFHNSFRMITVEDASQFYCVWARCCNKWFCFLTYRIEETFLLTALKDSKHETSISDIKGRRSKDRMHHFNVPYWKLWIKNVLYHSGYSMARNLCCRTISFETWAKFFIYRVYKLCLALRSKTAPRILITSTCL